MPQITVNGVALNVEISGPTGAPVVAFSNSLGTSLAMWDAVVPQMRGRYRVLRYDTRGHGRSATLDRPTTVQDLADDLLGLLDALQIRSAHLVGLSLGGMTAQSLASRHPERVRSLTLMATSAHMPTRESWEERAGLVRAQGTGAIVDAAMGRWFTSAFAAGSGRVDAVRDGFLATDRVGYAVACGAIGAMDLRPEIGRIEAPTLVMAGRDDPATPVAMAEEICAHISQAELVVIPRAAHLLAVERPEAVASHLLAFLDRHRDRGAERATGPVPAEVGLVNRKAVLGAEHVERSLAQAGAFARPWQDFIGRIAWGEVWGDPRLPWKTRSLVVLALTVALNREEEFKLHLRPALANGMTPGELQALLIQLAVYAGVPAANGAFRWAREVLGEELEG